MPSLQQCDVGQPLTCLAFSPPLQQTAVGGRDIRLFSVSSSSLSLQPRAVSSSGSLSQSATSVSDLSFHPSPHPALQSSLLAASTSGQISLYSLSSPSALRRPVRLFEQHTRTVNRVAWHSQHADVFYSASQDGSVLWWDVRVNGCVGGWDAEAGAARDVQMDKGPAGALLLAAAYEDGSVAVRDTRGGSGGGGVGWKGQLLSISAHQGYTLTLDWHPTDSGLLATGGKDRNVCVWDIGRASGASERDSSASTPLHTIATSSSVHRLAWRPHRPHQLASSASSSVDFDVQLWNVATPHIPLAVASHHRTAVAGIAFKESGDSLLSCTRGGWVSQLSLADCYQPYEHLSSVAVDWSVRDELAAVEDAMQRDRSLLDVKDAPAVFPIQFQWRDEQAHSEGAHTSRPGLLHVAQLSALVGTSSGEVLPGSRLSDVEVLQHCARHYRLHGDSVHRLCAHNASVALSVGRAQLAHIWDVLALLYGHSSRDGEAASDGSGRADEVATEPVNSSLHSTSPHSTPLPTSRAASRSSARTATPLMFAADTPATPLTEQAVTASFLAYLPAASVSSSAHHPVLQASAERSTGQLTRHSILLDTLHVVHASHVYRSRHSALHSHPTKQPREPARPSDSSRSSSRLDSSLPSPRPVSHPSAHTRVCGKLELSSHLSALLLSLLDQLLDSGDAQTCCSVVAVLSHEQPVSSSTARLLSSLPAARVRVFFFAYIDALHRLRLFSEATAVHALTPPHWLSPSNAHNTSVGLQCGECRRGCEASDEGCYCAHCGSGMSVCAVCELLVRGLYVWCQGCGHGGHAEHMEEWFGSSRVCPTGCMHRCVDELISAH